MKVVDEWSLNCRIETRVTVQPIEGLSSSGPVWKRSPWTASLDRGTVSPDQPTATADAERPPGESSRSSWLLRPRLLHILSISVFILILRYVVPPTAEEIQYRLTRGRQRAEYETSGAGLQSLKLNELSTAFQMVSQRVGPSVVHIDTQSNTAMPERTDGNSPDTELPEGGNESRLRRELREQGSGVVVDAEGYVVTNYHVVMNAHSITVTLSDGRRVPAKLIGYDWLTDVAVLKIGADGLIAADWGDSEQLREGALVWAVGTPYGLKRSITGGIVSAKSLNGRAGNVYQDYLQTDAAVNPGSSGGPLVDIQGKVVGINTAILGDSYRGISFAVPSNITRSVYDRIRTEGRVERGWLGVALEDVTPLQAKKMGFPRPSGALVRALVDGTSSQASAGSSPASDAGVQIGDVIVGWDQSPIDRKETLIRRVAGSGIGSQVEMDVIREGHEVKVLVTVGRRPRLPGG